MHRILLVIITICSSYFINTALATDIQNDSIDFCSLVNMVESNYAGFPTKVNDSTIDDYTKFKNRLLNSVLKNDRTGYDAAAEFVSWFNDYHLHVGSLSKKYMKSPISYDSIDYNPQFLSQPVDSQTYLIRIPSFVYEDSIVHFIEDAVENYKQSGIENLIIDIRGNGGGLDYTFDPIFELIYNKPFHLKGVEFRATPDISNLLRESYKSQNGQPSWALELADSIDTGRYDFVPIPNSNKLISLDKTNNLPHKVAIIIDNGVASSAEQFIVLAKSCSNRVILFGKDNTMGALDYSNLMPYDLPFSKITCYIPTSRTIGINNDNPGIDVKGIAPDIVIPIDYPKELTDNVDSWIYWVVEELKN